MASPVTVREIKRLDPDEIVRHFTGKITQLWKYNSGQKKGRDWSIQAGMIEDEDGGEIKFVLKDREEMEKSYNGKTVTILAHEGTKDWSGVYARDDEYEGKTNRVLWITATAEIVKGGRVDEGDRGRDRDRDDDRGNRDRGRDDDRGGRDQGRSRDDDRGRDRNEDRDRDRGRDRDEDRDKDRGRDKGEDRDRDRDRDRGREKDPVKEAKYELMRNTNLMGLCGEAAWYVCQELGSRHKFTATEDTLCSVWMTLFIGMQRQGWGGQLPIEDIFESSDKDKAKDKEDPERDSDRDKDKDGDKDKDKEKEGRGSKRK